MEQGLLVINAGSSIEFAGYADGGGAEPELLGKGQVEGPAPNRGSSAGMRRARSWASASGPERSPIGEAIERPSGLIVDALVEAGHTVVPIHPNVVKACRPRTAPPAARAIPATQLADILRTDGHRFRPLAPCSDEIKALRALVRGRDELVAERIALANRLRSLLDSFWPGAAAIFADVNSPIALAFLQRYPTPKSATRLGEKR